MSVLLLAVLAAAPSAGLLELPPLREGPTAQVLAPASAQRLDGTRLEVLRREFGDPRVIDQWTAACGAEAAWLAVDEARRVTAIGLFSQTSIWQVLALSAYGAASFNEASEKPPEWVPPALVDAVRERRARVMGTGGMQLLAEDPRDGSRFVYGFDFGYARVRSTREGPVRTAAFPPDQPAPLRTPIHAAWFDASRAVEAPWLLAAADPWQEVSLHLRAPDGTERLLLSLPKRESRGDYRVSALETLRLPSRAQPIVSVLVDGAHVVLWPETKERGTGFVARAQAVPVVGRPPPPPGETNQPRARGPACSDATQQQRRVGVSSPRLFEWRGRAFAAYLEEETTVSWRFGAVPRPGKTPAEDELTCDWLADAQRSHTALVLAAFTDDGHLREVARADVHAVGGKLELERSGDVLTVATSSLQAVTATRFDLVKVMSAAEPGPRR
jgi:hypothetical protein